MTQELSLEKILASMQSQAPERNAEKVEVTLTKEIVGLHPSFLLKAPLRQELPDKVKQYVSTHYADFSRSIEIAKQGVVPHWNTIHFTSPTSFKSPDEVIKDPLLELVKLDSDESYVRAMLQMSLFDYPSEDNRLNKVRNKGLYSGLPGFVRHVHNKSPHFASALEDLKQVDMQRISSMFRLGLPCFKDSYPERRSRISVILNAEKQKGNNVIVKKDMLQAAIAAGVRVQKNDLHDCLSAEDISNILFEDITQAQIRGKYGILPNRRLALLEKAKIMVKPGDGARGYGVVEMSLTEKGISVSGEPFFVTAFNALQTAAVKNFVLHDTLEGVEREYYENNFWSVRIPVGDEGHIIIDFQSTNGLFSDATRDNATLIYVTNSREQMYHIPSTVINLLENIEVLQADSDTLEFVCSKEKREDVILACEILLNAIVKCPTFAERKIEQPTLIEGKTSEVRVVNISTNKDRGLYPCGLYGKIGANNVKGGISTGGIGADAYDVIKEQLKVLRPDITDEDVHLYIEQKVKPVAAKAANAIAQEIVTRLKASGKTDIPETSYFVDALSTDFMFIEEGGELLPILIDTNLFFGTSGRRNAHIVNSFSIDVGLNKVYVNTQKFLAALCSFENFQITQSPHFI